MSAQAFDAPTYNEVHHCDDTVKINTMFLRSIHGIIKICEIVLCLICLICIGSATYSVTTTGWLNFVAATALVVSTFFLLLNLLNLVSRLPGPWIIIEFLFLALSCIFFTLSMIVAAASLCLVKSASIATAIFFAFGAVLFAAECIIRFRIYKEKGTLVISSTEVATVRNPDHSVAGIVQANMNHPDEFLDKPNGMMSQPADFANNKV